MNDAQYTKWENVNAEDIWAYMGFMILMGINHLPALADYWKLDPTYRYSPIADRITRDRFIEISRYLHFTDNSTLLPRSDPGYDKLGKVRPVIEILSEQFLKNYNPHRENSIDEAMIKFKGRSSMKQYLPKKPVKRGFKVWVRADAVTGYVCEFEVYTGKTDGERELGLGGNVVKKLTRNITGNNYIIYCDNFFTSAALFRDLLKDDIYACGTYNATRKCYPHDLKGKAKSRIGSRGACEYRQHGDLLVTLWQDTKTVSVLSTNCQPNSEVPVSRRQKNGSRSDVPCPEAIRLYNTFMAGVDKNDQLRGYYSVRTKSTKCYKYIFWFMFDVAIVNAFLLYNCVPVAGKRQTLKKFRVELAKQLIGSYNSRKYSGRPSTQDTSRHRKMHLPHYLSRVSQGRCRHCNTTHARTTTWYCNECQLRLCHTGNADTDCFLKHHLSAGLYSQP